MSLTMIAGELNYSSVLVSAVEVTYLFPYLSKKDFTSLAVRCLPADDTAADDLSMSWITIKRCKH